MKKVLLLMLMFLTLGISGFAQNTLTVANGTATNSYVPVYGYWADAYLRCQTIYTAGALDAAATGYGLNGGTITGLTYYLSSPASSAWTGTWEVKMMEVTASTLSAFVDMTNATTVYTGALDGSSSTMSITFTTPYTYQGGNLLIEVSQTTTGGYVSATFYGVSASGASWQGYNSSAWSSITGSAQNFMPKTTFTFTGGSQITCSPVQNLSVAATQTTSNSLTLTWSDAINSGATYTIYNMADSSVVQSGISDTSYTITGLNANTNYTFGVETNCSATDASSVMTVSGRTNCGVETLPFTEDFSASLSSDPCWTGATGTTAAEVFAGASLTLGTISAGYWNFSSSQNGFTDGHYYNNIYGTSRKSWMITPAIDLTTTTTAQLSFDLALTAYSGTLAAPATYTGGQKFMVIVSADGGNTWLASNATVWMNADSNANYSFESIPYDHYANYTINLNQYVGNTIKIAFYGESTVSGGDNNFHIDNVAVTEVPNCPNVMGLSLDATTATTANVSWNNNGASDYEVEVRQNGVALTTVSVVVVDTTAEISGLVVDNDYQVVVRSVCGSDYGQWSSLLNVHIGFCLPNPTSVDNDGIISVSFGGMTNTTHPTSAAYANYSSMSGTVPAGLPATVEITYSTGYTYGTIIWVDWNNSMSFEGNEVVYVGESSNAEPTTLTATFDVPATTPVGSYRMRILGADMAFDNYTSSIAAAASANPCGSFSYGVAEDYTLNVSGVPSCLPITNLTVDSVTATSVFLSWVDANNSGATYTIYNMADSSVVATGVSTTDYEVAGLTASTSYTFGVVANCSATEASSFVNVNATTDCTAGGCEITIEGHDSFGDGWNGNAIIIVQSGDTLDIFTIANGSALTKNYHVCSDAPVTFSWVEGSYPSEVSFEIFDGSNTSVFTGAGSSMTAGLFYTMNTACPTCLPAAALAVDNASETSITISWTGTAPSYDLYLNGTFETNVTTTTYTFNNLTTSTAYTIGVQAICSATDSAAMVTIATSTECPDITTLPYNEGFENDLGCWSTINASSDGQPWFTYNCAGLSSANPHGGAYVASSWSWNTSPMHANAWLISPKFVLPNVTGDSLTFAWWELTSSGYPDHYSVVLSTTTKDTAAFTTVVYPYTVATGTWTMKTIDLTPYAGQSVYLAFHHVDYDANYLLIDDISLFQGAYVPPAPDTLTVTFAVNDVTMGTTVPAPGTYYYVSGDTVSFHPEANTGYHFNNWVLSAAGQIDTLAANYVSVYFLANSFMSYGTVTLTALFEADSTGTGTNPTVATNAASSIGQTSATLNATITNPDNVTITAKGFEWKATTGGTFTQIAGTGTGNTFTADLTGLTPNTGYTFKAFITYDGTTVYGSEMTFTTSGQQGETCDAPTNLEETGQVIDKAPGYLFVRWTDNAGASQWNLQYRIQGTQDWATKVVNTTEVSFMGELEANETYELRVQAVCNDSLVSDWSNTLVAVAQGVGIDDYTLDNSVTVYPNPTSGLIQILNSEFRIENVEVYDVFGKLLNAMSVNDHTANLDLGGYAKGTYFVKVTTERGVVTKRVVKN